MTAYAPLFALTVAHDYYGADDPAPIRLVPDAATAALVRAEGLRVRLREGVAEAFAPEADPDAAPVPLTFTFSMAPRDPALATMTAALQDAPADMLRLDASAPAQAASAQPRPANAPRAMLGDVSLTLGSHDRDVRRSVHIAAAALSWTYHILGARPDGGFGIRDRRDEIAFTPLGPRRLSNGVEALSFRSSDRIAARARAPARFDLIAEGPFGPRVVAPALPNAASSSLSLVDGRLNSDIFFHLG